MPEPSLMEKHKINSEQFSNSPKAEGLSKASQECRKKDAIDGSIRDLVGIYRS
jgi:hypothetical protein